jgi:hypothetical protein
LPKVWTPSAWNGMPALGRDLPDLLDRHQGAALAVRRLDRDQDRVGPEGAPHVVGIDQPLPVDRQVGHGMADLLQRLTGAQEGVVLDDRRDDVAAPAWRPRRP